MKAFLKREWDQLSTKIGAGLLLVSAALEQIPHDLIAVDKRLAWLIAAGGILGVLVRGGQKPDV